MKRSSAVMVLFLLAGAVEVYSQGQVSFSDENTSGPSGPYGLGCIQVLNNQSSAPGGGAAYVSTYDGYTSGTEYYGNDVNWAGWPLGDGYSVQLLIGAGWGDAASSLSPVGPVVTTWYLAHPIPEPPAPAGSGYWETSAIVNHGTPGEAVTVAVAVWNNAGGTVNTLAAALPAGDPWGISQPGNITLGGGLFPPASLLGSIQSFSIATAVPEPSTMALGVLGASALLFRGRK
jgi:hypothetical protein